MSYCVNCGVELDDSAEKCPLCDTPVINPNIKKDEDADLSTPYSKRSFEPAKVSSRYLAGMLSFILLVPNVISAITNMVMPDTGNWAVYVNGSSAMVFILFLVPFLFRKKYPYLIIAADTCAAAAYVFLMQIYIVPGASWYLRVALPFIVFAGAVTAAFYAWATHKKRDWPYIVTAVLLCIASGSVLFDVLFHLCFGTQYIFGSSFIIAGSCAVLIIFFVFVAKNRKFRAWLTRKMFI